MTAEQFMSGVRQNIARITAYQLGMDGTGGLCDCIGLVIGAIRLAGGKWTGTHGSNYAARNEMRNLEKITSAQQLRVSDLVFKVRKPGEANYALPDQYHSGPDRNDYYHVGIVTSVMPLEITHCTGVPGGIKKDGSLGNWQYAGAWKGMDETVETGLDYRVTGGRLKLRKGPGTQYDVLAYLPDGAPVLAGDLLPDGEWRQVSFQGQSGFAMNRYLVLQESEPKEQLSRLLSLLQQAQQTAEALTEYLKT